MLFYRKVNTLQTNYQRAGIRDGPKIVPRTMRQNAEASS